jgi:hypothetical protein
VNRKIASSVEVRAICRKANSCNVSTVDSDGRIVCTRGIRDFFTINRAPVLEINQRRKSIVGGSEKPEKVGGSLLFGCVRVITNGRCQPQSLVMPRRPLHTTVQSIDLGMQPTRLSRIRQRFCRILDIHFNNCGENVGRIAERVIHLVDV